VFGLTGACVEDDNEDGDEDEDNEDDRLPDDVDGRRYNASEHKCAAIESDRKRLL
jgi:hypothetical protein